jgi:hypothetical protein
MTTALIALLASIVGMTVVAGGAVAVARRRND